MRSQGGAAQEESGFGLLASLLVLMIVAVLGTTVISVTMTDLAISSNFQDGAVAFYAADSGVQRMIVDLAVDGSWTSSLLAGGALAPPPDTLTINGHTATLEREKRSGDPIPGYYPLGSAGSIGQAAYTRELYLPLPPVEVEGPNVWLTFPLRVSGTKGAKDPATSVIGVDVRVRVDPGGGPWSYALAAGDGWGSEAIDDNQGTLQIRGSVRVFGDQVNPPQIQWRGTAAVMNHYGGLEDTSRFGAAAAKLPPLDTVVVNGEVVETLRATVNIENADFQFLDYASWGEPDVSENGFKETLDGVYVDGRLSMDGAGGVHGEEHGSFQEDQVDFPRLSDPYTDPSTGRSYASHQAFLDSVSLRLPYERISQDTPAFELSDKGANRIAWDPTTGTLDVEGIIKRTGDLTLEFMGNADNTITYTGAGTIYATELVNIHADLLPSGGYLDRDNLGLIAGDTLHVGLKGNNEAPRIMAAAYGASKAVVNGGAHLAGSLVAGHVNFDGSAGTVAHVPRLSLGPPPGMPGSGGGTSTIIEIQLRDWHEQR